LEDRKRSQQKQEQQLKWNDWQQTRDAEMKEKANEIEQKHQRQQDYIKQWHELKNKPTAVLPQTFQASIACNLRKIAIAQSTPEDFALMALPPSALLCF